MSTLRVQNLTSRVAPYFVGPSASVSRNYQLRSVRLGFNDRPDLLMDFTSSVEEIQGEIAKVKRDGTTALLDALYLGLDRMKKTRNERKVLLIVSDGGDNHSRPLEQ